MTIGNTQSAVLDLLQGAMRRKLDELQREAASGKRADRSQMPAALLETLHRDRSDVEGRLLSARVTAGRMQVTENSMTEFRAGFEELRNGLAAGLLGKKGAADLTTRISARMSNVLAVTFQGVPVFAVKPGEPTTNVDLEIRSSFDARFGFGLDDPRAASLTDDELVLFAQDTTAKLADLKSSGVQKPKRYLDRPYAHEASFARPMAAADVMRVLAQSELSEVQFGRVSVKLAAHMGEDLQGLLDRQADIGRALQETSSSEQFLSVRLSTLEQKIGGMENADLYSVAGSINQISNQLDASYRVISKSQQLTLARFL